MGRIFTKSPVGVILYSSLCRLMRSTGHPNLPIGLLHYSPALKDDPLFWLSLASLRFWLCSWSISPTLMPIKIPLTHNAIIGNQMLRFTLAQIKTRVRTWTTNIVSKYFLFILKTPSPSLWWVFFCLLNHKKISFLKIKLTFLIFLLDTKTKFSYIYLTNKEKPQRSGNYLRHDPP